MASSNRKMIRKLHAKLVKRYPRNPVCLEKSREILEHVVYAMFLENTSFETANASFSTLESYFVDWNEIRVSTARELAQVFYAVHEPERTGERLRRSLQYIFETLYKFDLEAFRPRGAAETFEFLESVPYSTDFINAYTVNMVFKIQDVPLDEGSLSALRLLDLVEVNEKNREFVPGLANALNQGEKTTLFFALHELGVEMLDEKRRDDAIDFLTGIDPQAAQRSWIPLVDLTEITDPVAIAKMLSEKEHKPKLPLTLSLADESDGELIDDVVDADILVQDDETPIDDVEPFLEDELEVCLEPDVAESVDPGLRKKKESTRTRAPKGDHRKAEPEQEKPSRKKESSVPAPSGKSEPASDKVSGTPSKSRAAKPAAKSTPKSAPKLGSKPSVKPTPKSAAKPVSKSGTKPVAKPKTAAKPEAPLAKGTASKKKETKSPGSGEKKKSIPVDKKPKGEKVKEATPAKSDKGAKASKKRPTPAKQVKSSSTGKSIASKPAVKSSTGKAVKSSGTAKKSSAAGKTPTRKDKSTESKKNGPKKESDKSNKVSAARKLLQKKPH